MNHHRPLFNYLAQYISLSPAEVQYLSGRLRYRRYRKGQYIVQEGDICYHISFVLSGCVRIFHMDRSGAEHILRFATEREWACDTESFLTQTAASYHVECLENTMVLQLSYPDVEELYERIPKLERFFRLLTQRALVAYERRIVRNLSLTAGERYVLFRKQYADLEQRIPQYMIASYLGITKEFLSKIRNRQAQRMTEVLSQ